jgi:hypothetical protein
LLKGVAALLLHKLLSGKSNLLDRNECAHGKMCLDLGELMRKLIVWRECCIERFNSVEGQVTEVATGEYVIKLLIIKEEGNTDAFEKELERFIHEVGEWDGNFEEFGNRGKVGNIVEVLWAIKTIM